MKKLLVLFVLPFLFATCTPSTVEKEEHQEEAKIETTEDGIALDERLPKGVTRPDYGLSLIHI